MSKLATFATLARAGSYAEPDGSGLIVGRLIANSAFLRALFRYGSFDRYCLFTGETADVGHLERLFVQSGAIAADRLHLPNVLDLPRWISGGELAVLHHASNFDLFFQLCALRDRHARSALPVTAQIHTLSYPRELGHYLQGMLSPPTARDAVFCSSAAGQQVVKNCVERVAAALAHTGAQLATPAWELPVVPLGVEPEALRGGERQATRAALGIPARAFVVLCLARFSEYDKMDLFPLLQAFRELRARDQDEPLYLLLAGSRQGTSTIEMLELWARLLRIEERVRVVADFPETQKRDLLAAADCFVSPCDNPQETFGISVVEALAAGLPAVVSDIDGYRETVTDEVGIRVATSWGGDLSALADLGPLLYERPLHLLLGQSIEVDLAELRAALQRLIDDVALRERQARAAATHVDARYSWRVLIPQYEACWRRLREKPLTAASPGDTAALRFDHQAIFAHYPTRHLPPARRVVRSALAAQLCHQGQCLYPIHAELRHVFGQAEVLAALDAAQQGLTVAALSQRLRASFSERPSWHADYTVAWLLKHGLLVDA